MFQYKWYSDEIKQVYNDLKTNFKSWSMSYKKSFYVSKNNIIITFSPEEFYFMINEINVFLPSGDVKRLTRVIKEKFKNKNKELIKEIKI